MKVYIAQQNYHIGNFLLNRERMLGEVEIARQHGADLVVFSELSVCVYPPRDFLEFEDYFIVDSMPLEICKFARHKRIKICKNEFETAPSKGFCASQNNWFYGYKLHGVCSINGIFHSLDITKAEVHDVHFLKNIKQQMSDCVLLGDRGYLSQSIQLDLFQTVNVKLETPKRINQMNYKPQPYIFKKSRKRIETLFSQL